MQNFNAILVRRSSQSKHSWDVSIADTGKRATSEPSERVIHSDLYHLLLSTSPPPKLSTLQWRKVEQLKRKAIVMMEKTSFWLLCCYFTSVLSNAPLISKWRSCVLLSLNIDEKKNYNSLTNQYYFVILETNGYINMDPEMNWTQIQLQAEADSL